MPAGLTDLRLMLQEMHPIVTPGEYVVVSLESLADIDALAVVVEAEGVTHVVAKAAADALGWPYGAFVGGWITLQVHSSLAAVGLTAAVSTALASAGISCNMFAGYFHDHLLVPHDEVDHALSILDGLSRDRP